MTKLPIQIPDYLHKPMNIVLIIVTSVLAIITFFAIQDILVTVTAFIVARTSSEPWVTVQDTYVVITVRNVWVFIGGILMLSLLIVGLDYHSRRLDQPRTSKLLFGTLLIELFFIIVSMLLSPV